MRKREGEAERGVRDHNEELNEVEKLQSHRICISGGGEEEKKK